MPFREIRSQARSLRLIPLVELARPQFPGGGTSHNPSRRLMPGMFRQVAVQSGDKKRYLTLPQTAITYNPYGATVFLANKSEDGSRWSRSRCLSLSAGHGATRRRS